MMEPREDTIRNLIAPIAPIGSRTETGQLIMQTTVLWWRGTETETLTSRVENLPGDIMEIHIDGTTLSHVAWAGKPICVDGLTSFDIEPVQGEGVDPKFRVKLQHGNEPAAIHVVDMAISYMIFTEFDPTQFITDPVTVSPEEE